VGYPPGGMFFFRIAFYVVDSVYVALYQHGGFAAFCDTFTVFCGVSEMHLTEFLAKPNRRYFPLCAFGD
jgi:hypothetical protein